MSFSRREPHLTMLSSIILFILLFGCAVQAADICQPVTWVNAKRRQLVSVTSDSSSTITTSLASIASTTIATLSTSDFSSTTSTSSTSSTTAAYTPDLFQNTSLITTGAISAGTVNCRSTAPTTDQVNYYTCSQLAITYGITIEKFFLLNPSIDSDCSNIQPSSTYCTAGYIEPLLAVSGKCGPLYNNATCVGTSMAQCCNAETWTCGNSTSDCEPGTCWGGTCAGDTIYSTDGTCGIQYGERLCAGKWGDCCNSSGQCGTGSAFCGTDACYSGNCTWPVVVEPTLPWLDLAGNTTDGTCGSANSFSCSASYGNCCNKDNICGSLPSDCGAGCQPQWGNCSTIATVSSESSSASSSKSSSMTSSSVVASITSSSKSTSITSSSQTVTSTSKTTTASQTSSSTSAVITAISALPSCGQLCFSNVIAQYSTLGCSSPDPSCLCNNVNFGYGIRDCANGACGTSVGSTVIAYESLYCSSAAATVKVTTTATGIAALPSCGQTCFNALMGQYSSLGCATPDPSCLCSNINFYYGIRDCSNGACGTEVASTVIAYESAYCAAAAATAAS